MYDCELKRKVDKIGRVMAVIGGVGITFMMVIVIVNVIARRILGSPIYGVQEIVRYTSLFIGSIGLLRLEWTDNSIRMTLFLELASVKTRLVFELLTNIVAIVGFSAVSFFLFKQVGSYARSGQLTEDIKIPMTIPGAVLAAGFFCLTICVLIKAILFAAALIKGEPGDGKDA